MAGVTQALSADVSDAVIIECSWREPESFGAIFDRYYAQIRRFAGQRLGQSMADDVAAETFLIAFDRRKTYDRSRQNARPWVFGIASNLIARHQRAEARQYRALARTRGGEISEGHAEQVVGRLDAEAHRGPLMEALAEIAARDRDVLLLVAWAEMSLEQAGEALGIPAGTARSRLHRARKKIRAALGRHSFKTEEEEI